MSRPDYRHRFGGVAKCTVGQVGRWLPQAIWRERQYRLIDSRSSRTLGLVHVRIYMSGYHRPH
jgi:hypothetical protein